MKKIYSIFLLALLALSGCEKVDFNMDINGEAVGTFNLSAPANNAMLVLNSGTPNSTVTIEWTAAKPGVSVEPTYKWVAALKTGDIAAPILIIPSDNAGKSTKLTLTQKAIDDALKAKGIAEGVKTDLIWSVIADNGSVKLKAAATYNISITRFGDGISNFKLYGPLPSNNEVTIDASSTADSLRFKWQKAFAGKAGSTITYKIKFVKKGDSFTNPLFQFNSKQNGADSAFVISYKDMDLALTGAGLDQSTTLNLEWTVEAKSGTFTKYADYVNKYVIFSEVPEAPLPDYFVPGSHQGWSPSTAPVIKSINSDDKYAGYVNFPDPENLFKITPERSWNNDRGGNWLTEIDGIDEGEVVGGGNMVVKGAGFYLLEVDLVANTYKATPRSWGVIGSATPTGWNSDTDLVYDPADGKLKVTLALVAGQLKFRADNDWAISYGDKTGDKILDTEWDNNINITEAGNYRIELDMRSISRLKYKLVKL